MSCGPMSQKHFEVVTSPRYSSVEDPSFGAALDRDACESNRRSGRDRRAPPIFAFPKEK